MMVTVYPSKKLGRVVLLHDYITLRNEKTDLEKETNQLALELDKSQNDLWDFREAEGFANSEIMALKAKVKSLEYEKDKLQKKLDAKIGYSRPEETKCFYSTAFNPLIEELKGLRWIKTGSIDLQNKQCETVTDMWMRYICQLETKRQALEPIQKALGKGEIPKFKIQVTSEQSEYVQKWIFTHGGSWGCGETVVQHTEGQYLCIQDQSATYGLTGTRIYWDNGKNDPVSFRKNKEPEITFDQFKEWAKPIEPEIKASEFPLLVVVEKNGYKTIGFFQCNPDDFHYPIAAKVYYWDKYNVMRIIDYMDTGVMSSGESQNQIKVTKTTIDKLKIGDKFIFSWNYPNYATNLHLYYHINNIDNDRKVCHVIVDGREDTKKIYSNTSEVYKFELK